MTANRKLAVCFPGDMSSVFMLAFESIVNIETPPGFDVKWFRGVGWCQARRRSHACEQAIEWGADLIAQLDVDQIYEPDVLKRLIARYDEGYRIIAAMVPGRCYVEESKMPPFGRLAWRSTDNGKSFEPVDPSEGEVIPVDFPTSACVLFAVSDLLQLRRPWYYNRFDPETYGLIAGEDGTFFIRMRQLGVQAYVDTTINVRHGHVFAIDDTFSERFADWATPGIGDRSIIKFKVEGADATVE